jgi:hypothetical protein
MARRGGMVARDGVVASEAQGGLKYKRAQVTTADDEEASPCYGGSTGVHTAGAADGLGVRRAHGAGTAAWPTRLEAPYGRASVRAHGPRAEGASGRCVGHGLRGSAGAGQ